MIARAIRAIRRHAACARWRLARHDLDNHLRAMHQADRVAARLTLTERAAYLEWQAYGGERDLFNRPHERSRVYTGGSDAARILRGK